jgi:hypothetical protein
MRIVAWWLRLSRDGSGFDTADELSLELTIMPAVEIGGPYGFGHRAHRPDPGAHYGFEADDLHRPHVNDPGDGRDREPR